MMHSFARYFYGISFWALGLITQTVIAGPVTLSQSSVAFSAGQTFLIDTVVTNISDLYAVQFDLLFEPTLLAANSISEGTFLLSGGPTIYFPGLIDNNNGIIANTAEALLGSVSGVSGSGLLATASFTALFDGTASFSLENIVLLDSNLNPIHDPNSVPEPGTIFLAITGLLSLIVLSGLNQLNATSAGNETKKEQLKTFSTINIARLVGLIAALSIVFTPNNARAQAAPFNQCPHVGLNTSCRILIVIDVNGGLRVLTDSNASPTYDGSDDTLVGVLNQSGKAVAAIPLHGPNAIFEFDGDGVCSTSINPRPVGCPFGSTGYEGGGAGAPIVSFSNISTDQTSGTVNFSPSIPANGGSAWFGLELAIQTQCSPITPPASLKQSDPAWSSINLGPSNVTIGDYGCFLTDLAMEINYYAQKQNKSFRTDPKKLNAFLTANGGIDNNGSIPDAKIPLVTQYAKQNGVNMYYGGKISHRDDFTLDQYVCNGYPPMLLVGSPHWVVATGQTTLGADQTYAVLDPDSWPNGSTLDNAAWNNTYKYIQLFSDLIGPLQGLYITAHSPIELLLKDPGGRQTGLDPRSNSAFEAIPKSSYSVDQLANDTSHGDPLTEPIKQLSVPAAGSGQYKLQLFGTGNGPYALDVTYYDTAGLGKTKTFSGTTSPGVISEITVQYSSVVGAPTSITALCAADVNRDGIVNAADFAIIQAAYGSTASSPRYNPAADINHDGRVDVLDLAFASRSLGCKTQTQ